MSSFTEPLLLEYIYDERAKFKLLETFKYYTDLIESVDGSPYIFKIFKGFVTDFASIPKVFHFILSPAGKHGKSAVVHDFLYYTIKRQLKEDLKLAESWVDVSIAVGRADDCRKLADEVFREAMTVLKVTRWKRDVMYNMVRLFGFTSIY